MTKCQNMLQTLSWHKDKLSVKLMTITILESLLQTFALAVSV